MSMTPSASSQEQATIKDTCGIDIGSQSCAGCICQPDKRLVGKPLVFANRKEGWDVLLDKLNHLDALAQEILIGMEATARYSENLYHALEQHGYRLCLLHPGQTHQFHERQGLRARAGSTRCDDHCPRAAQWRGTVRLYSQRTSGDLPRIGAPAQSIERAGGTLPEADPCPGGGALRLSFTQVEARPCLSTALAVLKAYRSRTCDGPGDRRSALCALACSEARPLGASDRQETA
jgi:transposase